MRTAALLALGCAAGAAGADWAPQLRRYWMAEASNAGK